MKHPGSVYIYIYRDSATVESTSGGLLTLAPNNVKTRESGAGEPGNESTDQASINCKIKYGYLVLMEKTESFGEVTFFSLRAAEWILESTQ